MKRTGAYGLLMLISYHWRIFLGEGEGALREVSVRYG